MSSQYELLLLQTSLWKNLHPHQVIGNPATVKEIDCLTATVKDISDVRSHISSSINICSARLCGFGGWFDVHFRVSWYSTVPIGWEHWITHAWLRCKTFFFPFCYVTLFYLECREEWKIQPRKRLSWQRLPVLTVALTGDNRYDTAKQRDSIIVFYPS